ncbi:MAG: GWxTD domain-containing protein, partial [Balneolaceae bacterium]|nr:GWxTD domain-containing protein [Balneolaceae bacterium]
MSKYKFLITAHFILLCFLLNVLPAFGQVQQAYERGMEELYRGNVSQALDIWYNSYEQAQQVDSRIGFEYIRVVTEQGMRNYFESATKLYYRALTNGKGMESRVALRQEIERMKPIIGEGIYRQWMNWWNEEDPSLHSDMKGFWIQNNPTPANATNERLIEHWQRIATARQQFTKNETTVYGTDSRALIYVRYGEADRVRNGILTLQGFNIQQWLENQLMPEFEEDDPMPETVRSEN